MRQVAPLPTYEEIVDQNDADGLESENDKHFLKNELKTEPPTYEEALLME